MFATALTIALAGFLALNESGTPSWYADYAAAQILGREQSKPLAVFVGSGDEGWNQVNRDGRLAKEIKQLLADTYICVYVDTAQANGKGLAAELEISNGLVVSDQTGTYQAFRHQDR